MEYVDGSDLSAIVKERGPLPVDEAINYIRQAACGLAYAHAEGRRASRHQARQSFARQRMAR